MSRYEADLQHFAFGGVELISVMEGPYKEMTMEGEANELRSRVEDEREVS
jgi:hypothetical protein